VAHLDQFELRTPCDNYGCRTVALHFLRGISTQADGCRLMGRTCQVCGRHWQEYMAYCNSGRHAARR